MPISIIARIKNTVCKADQLKSESLLSEGAIDPLVVVTVDETVLIFVVSAVCPTDCVVWVDVSVAVDEEDVEVTPGAVFKVVGVALVALDLAAVVDAWILIYILSAFVSFCAATSCASTVR